ncbi:MAG: radical SAM family heme chaperone HemW [Candidatus Omnitrophica bacterium]|nr:radical SAM family heme chaperone HemW [Candidatus Omnitrophota bacterium]
MSGRSAVSKTALYIHIPFCRNKCPYCGFYSVRYTGAPVSAYLDSLIGELNSLEHSFSTIYIGGGTPSVLRAGLLRKLFRALRSHSADVDEFTMEVNPESLDAEKLSILSGEGLTRLSIGVQSFCDDKLKRLGRIHGSGKAEDAIKLALKSGIKNINIDLIFGVAGEGMESWKGDIEKAVSFPIQHISCYSLTHDKELIPADDDVAGEMYDHAISALANAGFVQYEISNFSLDGFTCRHNLNYWSNGSYIGLGPSAVSYVNGVRSVNIPDVGEYIKRSRRNESAVISSERLSPERSAKETASVKIRTNEGIDFEWFEKKTGFNFMDLEKTPSMKLSADGLIDLRDNSACLTRKGILFCDIVSSELL